MTERIEELTRAFRRDPGDEGAFAALRRHYQSTSELETLGELHERHAEHQQDPRRAAELLWRASELARQREDAAGERRALYKILNIDQGHRRALDRLSSAAEASERWAELVELLAHELKLTGDSRARAARLDVRLGQLWEEKLHRIDRAIVHYKRAFKADPTNTEAIEAGRRIFASFGQWETVAQLFEVELTKTTDPRRKVELLVELAELQRDRLGDLEAAARALTQATQARPGNDELLEPLGELYASPEWPSPGGLDKAAAIFMQIAQRHQSQGDREAAIAYLRRALGADPENEGACTRLDRAYRETGRWEDLDRLYRQRIAVATELQARDLQMRRAELLERKLGDPKGARECYEAVLPQEPLGGPASKRLKELYRTDGDWESLMKLFERELEAAKDRPTRLRLMLEIAQLKREQLDDAEGAALLLHEVLQVDPTHRKALTAYEDYFRQKGDFRNLSELLRFAAQSAREAGAPPMEVAGRLEELAEVSELRLGDLEGAIDAWRQIAEVHPDVQRAQAEAHRIASKLQIWRENLALMQAETDRATTPDQRLRALRRTAQLYREHQIDPLGLADVLREILQFDPNDEHGLRMLIDVYEREADYEGLAWALRARLEGIVTGAERATLLRRLAEVCADELDRPAEGLKAYKELLQLVPNDKRAMIRVQRLLDDADDLDQLMRLLEHRAANARSADGKLKALRDLAHLVDERLEAPSRALSCWEEVRQLAADDEEALEALSRLYQRSAQPGKLIEVLQARLDAAEDGPMAARAALLREIATVAEEQLEQHLVAIDCQQQLAELLPASRDALRALTRLHTKLERHQDLVDVLERQIELADDAEERVALAFKQVDVLENELGRPEQAIEVFERIVTELAPADIDAHRRLKLLHVTAGNHARAAELAERELFLTPVTEDRRDERLELALEAAKLWHENVDDTERSQLAYERVLELAPHNATALVALRKLYHRTGSYSKLLAMSSALFNALEGDQERQVLLFELAQVCERNLREPLRGFEWYRRAHALFAADGSALAQLQRMAADHGLWEELITVYAESRRQLTEGEPGAADSFLTLTAQIAAICRDRLEDPARAFEVLREGLRADPSGERVLPELEQLAHAASLDHELLEAYQQALPHSPDHARQADLLARAATLAEERLADPARALQALLRRFSVLAAADAISPADEVAAVAEIERIAEASGRYTEALALHQQRLQHAATDEQQLEILLHVADMLENKVGDSRQAFGVYLRAFQLQQQSEYINNAWRLARVLSRAPAASAPTKRPPLVVAETKPRAESTIEISQSDILDLGGPARREIAPRKTPRGDATIELSQGDLDVAAGGLSNADGDTLVIEATKGRREDSTIDLTVGDLVELAQTSKTGPGDHTAPPTIRLEQEQGDGPMAEGPVTDLAPWEAIARTYLELPAEDDATRLKHLLAVGEVWHEGAADAERAFRCLTEAALLAPFDPLLERRLRLLGEQTGQQQRVITIYSDLIEHAADASTLLRLHLKVAGLILEHDEPQKAEGHLAAALAIDPTNQEAADQLSAFYQRFERWQELAQLLARQLETLADQLSSEQRADRLGLLADLNQYHLGHPFEAAEALARLAAEQQPAEVAVLARLADLYQQLTIWPKAIETIERMVELAEDDATRAAQVVRIARAFRDELELPDRAIESFERALIYAPDDLETLGALEALYREHDRPEKLAETLERQVELADPEEEPRAYRKLLARLGRALEELADFEGAAAQLQRARGMGEPDPDIEEGLARVLVASGQTADAVQLLDDQVERAISDQRPPEAVAAMLVSLARLQRDKLEAPQACAETLERALFTAPGNPEALAELAAMAASEQRWERYAELQLLLVEGLRSVDDALGTLGAAGRLLLKHEAPAAAARVYDRALQLSPEDQSIVDVLLDLAEDDQQRRHDLLLHKLDLVEDLGTRGDILTEVGRISQQTGSPPAEVAEIYEQVLAESPDHVPALDALSALHIDLGREDAARQLLEQALARIEGTPAARQAGQLYYRLGEIFEALGESDAGYKHLMQALRLQPRNLLLRLAVGRNRYQAHRWREALRHFGEALGHDDAPSHADQAADALYCAGLCERRLRRPDRALPFFEAAVELDPDHVAALKELASAAIDRGAIDDAAKTLQRVARVTEDPKERAKLLTTLGELYLDQLDDQQRAAACYADLVERSLDPTEGEPPSVALDEASQLALLPQVLPVLLASDHHRAAALAAEALARSLEEPREQREQLLVAASRFTAAGDDERADARRREVLELDPGCGEAVAGLADSLERQQREEEAVELLEAHLWRVPPPRDEPTRVLRARLYETLARVHRSRGQIAAAIEAIERRLKIDEDLDVRRTLAELHDEHGGRQEAALANHRVLARDVANVASLRLVGDAALANGALYRAFCVSAVLDALEVEHEELRQQVVSYVPPPRELDEPYDGEVTEADRLSFLTLPAVNALRQVFATIWEAAPSLFARDISEAGVSADDRVSPVERSNLALVYSNIARALGIKRSVVYLRKQAPAETPELTVLCMAPTAVIATEALAARPLPELRFLLARALELTQPAYVLAAGLPRRDFAQLLSTVLHTFHPRHMRRKRLTDEDASEAERIRSALPYKVSRKLSELFREQPEVSFDSGAWRQAVQMTVNRMGLLFCGDLDVALGLIRAETPELADIPTAELAHSSPLIRDLLNFAASDAFYICRGKLGQGESS